MAITATAYPTLALRFLKGEVDFDTATVKVSLHSSSYTPNKDHDFYDDVTNEVTGTGYTAGGQTVSGVVLAYDSANDRATLDCNDVTWTTVTVTYRYAVWYVSTGVSSTSPLIAWTDFGTNQSPAATNETLVIDSTGLLRIA